jgi:hypothetical protein
VQKKKFKKKPRTSANSPDHRSVLERILKPLKGRFLQIKETIKLVYFPPYPLPVMKVQKPV